MARLAKEGWPDAPPQHAQAELQRLLASGERKRIASAVLNGRRIWIKRYDTERKPLAKRLHELLSPLAPKAFMRASPLVNAQRAVERELRKMEAFRTAGFAVPPLVCSGEAVIVLGHVNGIAAGALLELRETDPQAHDDLLIGTAAALGRVHAAGLCHGRPHVRDMFLEEGRWGFIDFEEEPEAVMPLRTAQARDLWLLFLQISSRALLPETQDKALAAYLANAPAGVLDALLPIVGFFSPLLPPLALLEKMAALGSDGRRILKGTEFLKRALSQESAPAGQRQGAAVLTEGVKEGP